MMSGSASTTIDHARSGLLDAAASPLTKINEVTVERHRSNVVIFVKLLVNGGDGRDARGSVMKLTCRGPCCTRLQMQDA